MDIKLKCINGFKLIELTENNHFVQDRCGQLSIYNALIVSQKGNPFLWMGICRIIMNVKNNFYGIDALSPTGPRMLGNIILRRKLRTNIDMKHYQNGGFIIYKNFYANLILDPLYLLIAIITQHLLIFHKIMILMHLAMK